MNDDFIKRHRQRPDPKFVERLYQKINTTPQRSFSMFNRRVHTALIISMALILTAVLTFTFSPTVRAAVQAILTFNGVTVSIDEATGKLVVSGNKDAIVEQTDTSVTIKGENGDMAGAGVALAVPGELVDVSALLIRFPDLTLPNVPAGYTIQPQGQLMGDGSLLFTWQDANGHLVTYQRITISAQGPSLNGIVSGGLLNVQPADGSALSLTVASDGTTGSNNPPTSVTTSGSAEITAGSAPESGTVDLVPLASYTWESAGYYHMLFASDPGLTETDLKAMLP
jgi:hypothetical protein